MLSKWIIIILKISYRSLWKMKLNRKIIIFNKMMKKRKKEIKKKKKKKKK
jgi:hypothetical protein